MSCNTGFRFETYNSSTSQRQRASSFYNVGVMNTGTADTTPYFVNRFGNFGGLLVEFIGTIAGSKTIINATNVVMPGTNNMGFESLLTIKGDSVNLSRTTINSELSGLGVSSGASINFFLN